MRGVSVQGVSVAETPSTVEERAVCILLECILVLHNNLLPPEYAMDLFDLKSPKCNSSHVCHSVHNSKKKN